MIITGKFCSEAAAQASAINYKVIFRILAGQAGIHELHVIEHFLFTPFSRTFSKAPVINQHHIVIIAVKIAGISGPSFYAPAIPMKIQDQSFWLFAIEMQTIDPNPLLHIKIQFTEGYVKAELEIRM